MVADGPVPSGTGWWFAFVFGGIIGSLVGAMMAGNGALIFAGIFVTGAHVGKARDLWPLPGVTCIC